MVAACVAIAASACSSSSRASSPPTTLAPVPATAPAPTSSTVPTTIPPTITTTPISGPSGSMLTLATITGSGDTTVAIPASVGVPAIVHAEYDGDASFVVDGLDAHGSHLTVLANTLGRYDGTFPVGFVDQADVPTTSLRVETIGAWHLDIASAVLAHLIPAGGQLGKGDAVLLYKGPAVSAHITYPGTSAFAIETFDGKVVTMLVTTVGPYDARITLPAGPAFISVTAAGDWSMSLG